MEESLKLNMQMYDPETVLAPLQKLNLMDDFLFDVVSVGVQGAIRSMKDKFKPLCRYFRSAYVSVRVVQVPKRDLNLFLHDSQTSTAGISALFKADD